MPDVKAAELVTFDVAPEDYRHWRLTIDGRIATLAMNVNEDAGLRPGYKLKLNSYDLGVDIELYNVLQSIRFEHPEVACVVLTSARERMFCAGANIYMLGTSTHAWKVNFCKFTNETRNGMEDSSRHDGLKFLAALNGTTAGGGYELALACDEIVLIDDRSSAVSLPEVPLLGVLPGTGGLTRVVDKRKVRRDLADMFCTNPDGVKGERAKEWGLVDDIAVPAKFPEVVRGRAEELVADSTRPASAQGHQANPAASHHRRRRLSLSACRRDLRSQCANRNADGACARRQSADDRRGDSRRRRSMVAAGDGSRAGRCHPDAARQRA